MDNEDIKILEEFMEAYKIAEEVLDGDVIHAIEGLIARNKELEEKRKDGTLSDGYHTYNDLYYQRCILFATICNLNKNISWKSKKHSDGGKCFDSDNWFIVGIDTPKGIYTYHYEMKYWDLFEVKELEIGKVWDGHTEKDVTRLFSLEEDYIPKSKVREKIEELEKDVREFEEYWSKDPRKFKREMSIDYYKLEALQELLED